MESAVAVHTKGWAFWFQWSVKCSMRRINSFTFLKEPRRIVERLSHQGGGSRSAA